jgi:hypothetical protein
MCQNSSKVNILKTILYLKMQKKSATERGSDFSLIKSQDNTIQAVSSNIARSARN